jgi:hypothetical protein
MKRALPFVLCLMAVSSASGDWVKYSIPRTDAIMLIPARETKVLPGNPPKLSILTDLGPLYADLKDCKIIKAKTPIERYEYMEAQGKKNVQKMWEAAEFALKSGMIDKFHAALKEVLKLDPNHKQAQRMLAFKEKLDKPIKENSLQQEQMKKLVKSPGMKFKISDHFLLMHDTPDTPPEGRKKTRAEQRVELLERVYRAFMYKFHMMGDYVEIPKEPLKVVLFNEYDQFQSFGRKLGGLQGVAGFYEHTTNTAVFYDQGTHPMFKGILEFDKELQNMVKDAQRAKARGLREVVQLAKSIKLLVYIIRESQDVEVVSHEATHQLAANTGLLPRHVMIPSWVHEGLATYFESPKDASWAGFGAVNEDRKRWYEALAKNDPEHSTVDFIVGNEIFEFSGGIGSNIMHAYAQAWSLTHFLLERYPEKFMAYYRRLGEMPPDLPLSAEVLRKIFRDVFGESASQIDSEWHLFMGALKTDKELAGLDD